MFGCCEMRETACPPGPGVVGGKGRTAVPPPPCYVLLHLFIVAIQVMTVVRDNGSLAPLADKNLSDSSGVDTAAVAARKSVDSGPSRTPSSLAFFDSSDTQSSI